VDINMTCRMWVVGGGLVYQAVWHLTGLRGRSVTLGLQKAQLQFRSRSVEYWTMSESLIWRRYVSDER